MREIIHHRPGRIFLVVLFVSIAGMIFVARYFIRPLLVFGWMTFPLFAGLVFVFVWLIAYLVYFFKFWPYR